MHNVQIKYVREDKCCMWPENEAIVHCKLIDLSSVVSRLSNLRNSNKSTNVVGQCLKTRLRSSHDINSHEINCHKTDQLS